MRFSILRLVIRVIGIFSIITEALFSDKLKKIYDDALAIKIFVPPLVYETWKNDSLLNGGECKYWGHKLEENEISPVFRGFQEWIYLHDEYRTKAYIMRRLLRDTTLYTSNLAEAHLCYPNCRDSSEPPDEFSMQKQGARFEVAKKHRNMFPSQCPYVGMYIEEVTTLPKHRFKLSKYTPSTDCLVIVPYVHSIYDPGKAYEKVAGPTISKPWAMTRDRTNLLSFFGKCRAGRCDAIHEMLKLQKDYSEKKLMIHIKSTLHSPSKLFHFTDVGLDVNHDGKEDIPRTNSSFFMATWFGYAVSQFTWQPSGDTG
jgi:hypothetical protein